MKSGRRFKILQGSNWLKDIKIKLINKEVLRKRKEKVINIRN